MEKLLRGIVEFHKKDFEKYREVFTRLGKRQKPHTLFIGCSDSRVVPSLITKTSPGELFIIRNIANMVPPYRITDEYLSTTSAIEYAVIILGVENIIVCGHSNCGGCAAIHMQDRELDNIPHTKKWLELAHPVREKIQGKYNEKDTAEREWITEQTNILVQMKNLLTYPYISDKFSSGTLAICGWHYIIETGDIYSYDSNRDSFGLIN